MTEHVLVSSAAGVMDIRLNRPDKRNALTVEMYQALADALASADADPAVRVVLLGGNGENFTAGNDLNDFIKRPPLVGDSPSKKFLHAISTARKILVAAVHGNAVGIGTTMLLHCDFIVAARNARLHLPFVNLGVVPEAASSLLLPRLIGYQRAAELFLLGEPIDAEAARDWGIVGRVVDDAELIPAARALAAKLAAKAPEALRLTKALMKSATTTVADRMAEEGRIFGERLKSPELKEAVSAFFEKRAPDFSKNE